MEAGSDRERWNEKHGQVQVGGWIPRPWLVEHRALLEDRLPGRALDVACGEALAPGGLLFFETFTRDHVDVLGRDMDERFMLAAHPAPPRHGDRRRAVPRRREPRGQKGMSCHRE